jgi:hypothetical protein
VQLAISDCMEIPGADIEKLVALELAPHAGSAAASSAAGSTMVSLQCLASHATITVTDPRRRSPLVLELDLAETREEARPRLLALAVAELVATSRLERVDARAQKLLPPPVPEARRDWRVWLAGGALRGYDPALFAPAAAAGLERHVAPFVLAGDLVFERGQERASAAQLTAYGLSASIAPGVCFEGSQLELLLAIGARAGYARLSASPLRAGLVGRELSGFFLAPIAQSALQVKLSRRWAIRVALELGYVAKPVRGLDTNGQSLLAQRGLRLSATGGLALSL